MSCVRIEGALAPWSTSASSSRLLYTLPIRGRICLCSSSFSRVKNRGSSDGSSDLLIKERHRFFDEAMITVRSGEGGRGAILTLPKPKEVKGAKMEKKWEKNKTKKKKGVGRGYYYRKDESGSLVLPVGGQGGDVVFYADERVDNLLEFHVKRLYTAKSGGSVNSMGIFTPSLQDGIPAPLLRVPVPVGTVLKRKGKSVLADLVNHGDEVIVARGGQGGITMVDMKGRDEAEIGLMTSNVFKDQSDKVLVEGQAGEEIHVELILRLVADVGLIGLPNAGKSTLLAAITPAKPGIANYPFTTLMPNLGRLDGDPSLGAGEYSSQATLADMPGLIKGAHLGKGLGRNFLRHLRRTRLLVHVVDVAVEDPIKDFRIIREELRMYNQDYLLRPYVVVLNKMDLVLETQDQIPSLVNEISNTGCVQADEPGLKKMDEPRAEPGQDGPQTSDTLRTTTTTHRREIEDCPPPLAVVPTSLLKGVNVDIMLREIRNALQVCRGSDGVFG